MKSNKIGKYTLFSIVGFMIFFAGLVMLKSIPDAQGIMRTLPYICIGVGSGIFGQNLGTVISILALRKDPQSAKRIEIETNDERNITIRNRAKGKSYDLMVMVFGALMMAFALMQVDMYVILAFVAAYLFIVFSNIYYLSKFQKEM